MEKKISPSPTPKDFPSPVPDMRDYLNLQITERNKERMQGRQNDDPEKTSPVLLEDFGIDDYP